MSAKRLKSALISVYHKDGLEPVARALHAHGVTLYSTGGTERFLSGLGLPVVAVESLTGYPSVLGGRVKTLHPKVFGGILHRRDEATDQADVAEYELPSIDLVVVDLYPFEAVAATAADEPELIEKIDIGGIALIRAAAKNYRDTVIVPDRSHYGTLLELLDRHDGATELAERQQLALAAFDVTSRYDAAIYQTLHGRWQEEAPAAFKHHAAPRLTLRYGENPHQQGHFYGPLHEQFEQLHGKELSYNNLVDADAALRVIGEFADDGPAYAILKHTNACGLAVADTPAEAYRRALAADPVSAFGGVIATNRPVDAETAALLHELFFELLIAPDFDEAALPILRQKKNRVLLRNLGAASPRQRFKSLLNGVVVQDDDRSTEGVADFRTVTKRTPTEAENEALAFAVRAVKHTKSNAIVLARAGQLLASGVGQTSRVDALRQAIEKARHFGFELQGSVMASDAFFPFADCVTIAHEAGVTAVVQPGGSRRDQESIDYCDAHEMAMVFTGRRHFLH